MIVLFIIQAKETSVTRVVGNSISHNIDEVVDVILNSVTLRNPELRYVVGSDAKLVWIWLTRMPTWISDVLIKWISKIEIPAKLQG